MQITPKNETRLVGATTRYGSEIRTYDDGRGPLWIVRGAYGVRRIIRASSWYTAYAIHIDEEPTIPESELPEAYGFDSPEEFRAAVEEANRQGYYPDLAEGYRYQDNATGTGIVAEDYCDRLDPLTSEMVRELEIGLSIERL